MAQALREALLASVWVAALAGCAVLSARLRAEDLFSLESMIEKYKGMYERLVG